ncbi:protein kinase, partial [Trypanosoma conorhini]
GRLCPENVMVGVEGRCRLKGMLLGAAPLMVHHESYYVSPEVAAGGAKTAASDMYALGLLLLAMLVDSHPWQWNATAALDRSRKELDSLLADSAAFREALRHGLVEPVPPPADVDDALRAVLKASLCAAAVERGDVFLAVCFLFYSHTCVHCMLAFRLCVAWMSLALVAAAQTKVLPAVRAPDECGDACVLCCACKPVRGTPAGSLSVCLCACVCGVEEVAVGLSAVLL